MPPRFTSNPYHKQQQMADMGRLLQEFGNRREEGREKEQQRWSMDMKMLREMVAGGSSYESVKGYLDKWQDKDDFSDKTAMFREIIKNSSKGGVSRAEAMERFALPMIQEATNKMIQPTGKMVTMPGMRGGSMTGPGFSTPADNPMARFQLQQAGIDPESLGLPPQFDSSKLGQNAYGLQFQDQLNPDALSSLRFSGGLDRTPQEYAQEDLDYAQLGVKKEGVDLQRSKEDRLSSGLPSAGKGKSVGGDWLRDTAKEQRDQVKDQNRYGTGAGEDREKQEIPSLSSLRKQLQAGADEEFYSVFKAPVAGWKIKFYKRMFDKIIRAGGRPDEAIQEIQDRYL